MSALEVSDVAFPGRAAFDAALSRAVLREVAQGRRGETLRLYVPDDVVAFSTTDLRSAGFDRAVCAARAAGFDAALRLAGGSAAVFHRGAVAFAWCTPETDERSGIRERFARVAGWVARALGRLGVDARIGEVPGAYCPGDFSVNARGRRKLMGVGQRIVRGASHTGGVIVVRGSGRVRAALVPVYAALGLEYDPDTTGAIEDEIGAVSVDEVRAALLGEIAAEREIRTAAFGEDTLEQAVRFEPSYRVPQTQASGARSEPKASEDRTGWPSEVEKVASAGATPRARSRESPS